MAAAASASSGVVLVTGASRGIGLGLVEAFAAKKWRVIATARDPSKADKLQALAKANSQVSVIALDVADSKSVATLPAALNELKVTKLDVLVNNAGVNHSPPNASARPGLTELTVDNFLEIFRTNVVAVWDVSQTLLPFVRKAEHPRVVHISSIMGSIDKTASFPFPMSSAPYRVSKSAVNELAVVQSKEWNAATVKAQASGDAKAIAAAAPLISVVAVHPGWVATDMGNAGADPKSGVVPPVTVPQSSAGIVNIATTVKPQAVATFLDFEGNTLPW